MQSKKLLIKNCLCLFSVAFLAIFCGFSCNQKTKITTPRNSSASVKEPPIQSPPVPEYLFKVAVYGDTRSDPAHGDGPHQVHREIISRVMSLSPSLVLQTGDLVYRGTLPEEWKIFDEITAEMRNSVAYYPARGNHDVEPGGDTFQRHITNPILSGNKLYYSFEKENFHFVAIDTEQSLKETDEQYRWLEDDLQKAKAADKVI